MPADGFVAHAGLRQNIGRLATTLVTPLQKYLVGPAKLRVNRRKNHRQLELGPGTRRLAGFETLNVVGGRYVDYVSDATKRLPFSADVFDLVYASHVLEHVAWYRTKETLVEWVRILKPGGALEVWVPDGLKIAEAFVEAERTGRPAHEQDGWWRFNETHDPCLWMAGRLFSYGDGTGTPGHFNWHLAMFSERRLKEVFGEVGLVEVRRMDTSEVRGFDHGWINLGMRGTKPLATNHSS
jgi:SAM-dependent methyltransferase